jgi:hypothetical protein
MGMKAKMAIHVLLSGRLKLDGYGNGHLLDPDSTYRLVLEEGSTVHDVIEGMGVPEEKVSMTMINGHQCRCTTCLKSDDRVILIPEDVAAMWRFLGRQNLGYESVFDFS